jgi:phosphoenolpyruvate carboxylase
VQLDEATRRAYRELVATPGFADVVALASPLEELGELRMGSWPVRRSGAQAGRDPSDLRELEQLRAAARDWPLFAALLEVAELEPGQGGPPAG